MDTDSNSEDLDTENPAFPSSPLKYGKGKLAKFQTLKAGNTKAGNI